MQATEQARTVQVASSWVDVVRLNRLARQLREVALRASQDGAELPVSVSDLTVIESVARHPDCTISEISRSTGLAQSRVSTIVQELTKEGVFHCHKDAEDRRQTRVRLHPAAHEQTFEQHGKRSIDGALAVAFPHLDAGAVERVIALLSELADSLDDDATS
ncbi:MAG: MarR family winged helix-turn-helix transcriptional regulator [Frankiaceae bacterium]